MVFLSFYWLEEAEMPLSVVLKWQNCHRFLEITCSCANFAPDFMWEALGYSDVEPHGLITGLIFLSDITSKMSLGRHKKLNLEIMFYTLNCSSGRS